MPFVTFSNLSGNKISFLHGFPLSVTSIVVNDTRGSHDELLAKQCQNSPSVLSHQVCYYIKNNIVKSILNSDTNVLLVLCQAQSSTLGMVLGWDWGLGTGRTKSGQDETSQIFSIKYHFYI